MLYLVALFEALSMESADVQSFTRCMRTSRKSLFIARFVIREHCMSFLSQWLFFFSEYIKSIFQEAFFCFFMALFCKLIKNKWLGQLQIMMIKSLPFVCQTTRLTVRRDFFSQTHYWELCPDSLLESKPRPRALQSYTEVVIRKHLISSLCWLHDGSARDPDSLLQTYDQTHFGRPMPRLI